MSTAPSRWPTVAACLLLLAALAAIFVASRQLAGALSYALDDAYIHMAMARSFAEHGVWGITRQGFTSSSSSLIWTFTLAVCFKIFGIIEATPLVLNVALSALTVWVAGKLFREEGLSAAPSFALLLAIAFLSPLPALTFTGQEHVLQVLVTLLFVYHGAKSLAEPSEARLSGLGPLLLLGPLGVLTRFEGLFPAFIVCCLFLLRRRWKSAFSVGGATLAPLALFGAYSMTKGWYPLPNSVLMKGNLTRTIVGVLKGDPTTAAFYQNLFDLLGGAAVRQLITAPHVAALVVTCLVLYALRWGHGRRFWDRGQLLLFLFGATTFFHMQLAKVGWFFRYEAYLVALGLFAIGMTVGEILQARGDGPSLLKLPPRAERGLILALLTLSAGPLIWRGGDALMKIPRATKNIHEQQYQMGRFLRAHYQGKTVTANDIGAISFLADIGCVDLVGLASMEAAMLRRQGRFDAEGMDRISKDAGATIAVAYEPWLEKWGGVPKGWVKVGTWQIPDNVVVAHDTVTWYALSIEEALPLARALRAFSAELPEDIIEAGVYLDR